MSNKKTDSKATSQKTATKSAAASNNKKSTLHPNYRAITVKMTDGTEFMTRSTFPQDVLTLEVDKRTHPAWTKEANYVNQKANEVAKFNKKFEGLSFLSSAK